MPYLLLAEKGSGKRHRIESSETLAGRDPACGLLLEGDEAKTVSGRHARFFLEDGHWFVEDAGSRNGTYIGTRRLEPGARHALSVGDVVGLGMTGTQLSVQEAVGRAFAATMLESAPVPPPAVAGGTVPMRRSEALRAGINDPGGGEEIRLVLRGVQTGARSTGQGDRVTIGRALECLIRVEGESATSVSRVHAELSVVGGKPSLRDGGSRHGTFVNGTKIEGATPLKVGDTLVLGPGGPAFIVDELSVGGGAAPTAPSPDSTADQVFHSELPTPAMARNAVKVPAPPRPTMAPEVKPTPPAAPPRSQLTMMVLFAGIAAVAALIAVFTARRSLPESRPGVVQQSNALDSLRAAAARDAEAAQARLDSATRAGAAPETLDSLRLVVEAAVRRADSLRTGR